MSGQAKVDPEDVAVWVDDDEDRGMFVGYARLISERRPEHRPVNDVKAWCLDCHSWCMAPDDAYVNRACPCCSKRYGWPS